MSPEWAVQRVTLLGGKGLACSAPDALRAGDRIFLSARFGVDPEDGRIPLRQEDLPASARALYAGARYVDQMEWPITAQTWWIYEAFRRILAAHGATLENLVRTNTYFRDLQEFPAMERARAPLLPVDPPPSTVLQVPFRGLPEGARVYVEGVAEVPEAGPRQAIRSRLGSGAHYSWGVTVRDWAWVSGQTGSHPLRAAYVESLADLGAEGTALATGNLHLDQREGPITGQALMAYWRVRKILEDAAFSPEDIVQEKIYLRSIHHLPAVERARQRFYGRPEAAPPLFYLGVDDLGRTRACLLEIDVIAGRGPRLLPGDADGSRRPGAGGAVAGPFLTVGGYTARDPRSPATLRSADLAGRGRFLPAGNPLAFQALAAYERLEEFLRSHGSSLDRLVKAEVYVKGAADAAALDAVHTVVFPEAPPALSVVPMTCVDHEDEVVVKIGGVALAGA